MNSPFPGLHLLPHLKDESVTVQVLGRVLVQQPVPVVVVRPDRAPVALGRVEIKLGAVRVVLDPHVQSLGVDEAGDLGVRAVLSEHVPGEIKGRFRGGHLARVPVPFEKHGRLVGVLPGRLVGDRDLPDVPSFESLPDRI